MKQLEPSLLGTLEDNDYAVTSEPSQTQGLADAARLAASHSEHMLH